MTRTCLISPKTKDNLIMFFTGELDRKIRRFEKKKGQSWPDNYYCTLDSVSYVTAHTTEGYISDPTGQRAVKLADLARERQQKYYSYLDIKRAIDDFAGGLSRADIDLLQGYLGIEGKNIKKAARKYKINYKKARKQSEKIYNIFQKRIMQGKLRESV
ncbi:MAG: hypothetical protein ACOCQN_00620 [Halanaerobiaceae bacterium]